MPSCFSIREVHIGSVGMAQLWIQTTRITYLLIDDLMSFDLFDLSHIRCHTGAYLPFWSRFVNLYGFAWSSIFKRYMSSCGWFLFYDDSLVEPFLSHLVRLILPDVVVIFGLSYFGCIDSHIIISVRCMSDLYTSPWSYSRVVRTDQIYLMPYWGIFLPSNCRGDGFLTDLL